MLSMGLGMVYVIYWFSQDTKLEENTMYQIYFTEPVSGISEQSNVKYNGIKVGVVDSIAINQENFLETIVTIKVMRDTPVTTTTYATLLPQGITGMAYIGLKNETANGDRLFAVAGQTYPVIKTKPSFFSGIDSVISQTNKNLQQMENKLNAVLDDDNQEYIKIILRNLAEVTSRVNDNVSNLEISLQQVNKLLVNLNAASSTLPTVMARFDSTLMNLEKFSGKLEHTNDNFNSFMLVARQTLIDLNSNVLPVLTETIQQLDSTFTGLENLSIDIRHNPGMLVRGKVYDNLGPGEY